MCNRGCIDFGRDFLKEEDVRDKTAIEVGSFNVNGSFRPLAEAFDPRCHIGVDITPGPGVDEICTSTDLRERFGPQSLDLLICTEALEHIADWKNAISNFKALLRPNGVLLITTRSEGFGFHAYPFDFWRYEIEDFRTIFPDFVIEVLKQDPTPREPGVFLKARKPLVFNEWDARDYELYSILKRRRVRSIHALRLPQRKLDTGAGVGCRSLCQFQ